MSDADHRTFTEDFRRFFLRGLVVLLPTVLTLWIVVKAYQFVDNAIAEPINGGVRLALTNAARWWEPLQKGFNPTVDGNPQWRDALIANPTWEGLLHSPDEPVELKALRQKLRGENVVTWWQNHWYMDLIGLVVAIVAVYIAGRLLGGFFGRQIYRRVETLITSVPIFKQVYPYVKQVVDFLFSDDTSMKFNRVVAVQYPRVGIWSVGFVTGRPLGSLRRTGEERVTVFIPSSPTPFTGYTITVPVSDTLELPLTIDEAIRYAVSAGVLVPGGPGMPAEDATGAPFPPPPGAAPAIEPPHDTG